MSENNTTAQQATTAQEPEKTFTQSELDAIIGDRLKREREKYSDYESIKAKAAKYDETEEANKTELQKATDKAAQLQKELEALKTANSVREIREKVAKAKGVPVELLSGDDEEACTAQADAIIEFAKPKSGYPKVKDRGEATTPSGGSTTAEQFADWFNERLGKGEN